MSSNGRNTAVNRHRWALDERTIKLITAHATINGRLRGITNMRTATASTPAIEPTIDDPRSDSATHAVTASLRGRTLRKTWIKRLGKLRIGVRRTVSQCR